MLSPPKIIKHCTTIMLRADESC